MRTNPARFFCAIVIATVSVGCSASLTPNAATITPAPSLTATVTQTPTPLPTSTVTPTPTPIIDPNRQFLVEIADKEIWMISDFFKTAKPVWKDDDYLYGQAVWSHDGQWIAFSRTAVGCPASSSSIWISRSDGSEAHQISAATRGFTNPDTGDCEKFLIHWAVPVAWSTDDKWLAVEMPSSLGVRKSAYSYLLSVETGKLVPIHLKQEAWQKAGVDNDFTRNNLYWKFFSPFSNWAMMAAPVKSTTDDSLSSIPVLINLAEPQNATILNLPSEVEEIKRYDWLPDGKSLLAADQTESDNRLWKVDAETGVWKLVATQPISTTWGEISFLSWSPDGHWAAWVAKSEHRPFYYLLFSSTETGEITRSLPWESSRSLPAWWIWVVSPKNNWILTTSGASRLMIWDGSRGLFEIQHGEGLYLLDPSGREQDILIEYDDLVAQIPKIQFEGSNPFSPQPWGEIDKASTSE